MKRSEFEHAIRAAGSILSTAELLVIGSQAIHVTVSGDLPDEAQRSIEVDIVAFDGPHDTPVSGRAWTRARRGRTQC